MKYLKKYESYYHKEEEIINYILKYIKDKILFKSDFYGDGEFWNKIDNHYYGVLKIKYVDENVIEKIKEVVKFLRLERLEIRPHTQNRMGIFYNIAQKDLKDILNDLKKVNKKDIGLIEMFLIFVEELEIKNKTDKYNL